jgi:rubrerythrin
MATTYTTAATGGKTSPTPMSSVAPGHEMPEEKLEAFLSGTSLNGRFVADLLSMVLAHEQCGTHLYRYAAGRTQNPMLKARYEEFGRETEEHIAAVEQLIRTLGGDPGYVSPAARLDEAMSAKMMEATALLSGTASLLDIELAVLDAVLLAEVTDRANWRTLGRLGDELPDGSVKQALAQAVGRIGPQEDRHLEWAQSMREQMILLQAQSTVATKGMDLLEKAVAKVRDLFT